jgi:hypothetical protein
MNDITRKSIKTALVFAAVGAACALIMPAAMSALVGMGAISSAGALGTLTLEGVLHTTGVFMIFGAFEPLFQSVVNDFTGSVKDFRKNFKEGYDEQDKVIKTWETARQLEHDCGCHKQHSHVEALEKQAAEQQQQRN